MKSNIINKHKKNMKKKNNKVGFISKNYIQCFNYIKSLRKFIFIVVLLFLLFFFVGFVYFPENIFSIILEYMEKILQETQDKNLFQMIVFIFLNNIKVGFMGVASGLLLGIPPIFLILTNGYVVGFVSYLAVSSSGASSLLNLLPHGIFELPAIFISFAMGIKLGTFVLHKDKITKLNYFLKESLRVFLFVVIPLLIIAAIIEGILILF